MEYNYVIENVKILSDDSSINTEEIREVLEDANSPINRKYQEKLFNAVIEKAHIDFGDIPKSAGNIRQYSGYNSMVETLTVLENLAIEDKATNVVSYVNVVKQAIKNLEDLSSTYEKGFRTKTDFVALSYNSYVYFCVEATTALIYSFVDIMKTPNKITMDMKIVNTRLRADEFYFTQLTKFNNAQGSNAMASAYRRMLENMCEKGRDNFTGVEALGITAVVAIALSIIPITREIIYQIYNFRGNLAMNLETQATFLEMNRTCLEANTELTTDKKIKVLEKQRKLAEKLRRISDIIRVKSAKSIMDSKKELEKDNKMLSIDNIKNEISNSPLEFL